MDGCTEMHINKPGKEFTFFVKGDTVVAIHKTRVKDGQKIVKWYDGSKQLHRDGDLPAAVTYNIVDNKEIVAREYWYQHGKQHREGDLPAEIGYKNVNGVATVFAKYWYKNGQSHRDGDKPAYERHKIVNGVVVLDCQSWSKNGKKHREGGKPAIVYYDNAGRITFKSYYINGERHASPPSTIAARLAIIREQMAAIEAEIAAKSAKQ